MAPLVSGSLDGELALELAGEIARQASLVDERPDEDVVAERCLVRFLKLVVGGPHGHHQAQLRVGALEWLRPEQGGGEARPEPGEGRIALLETERARAVPEQAQARPREEAAGRAGEIVERAWRVGRLEPSGAEGELLGGLF